MDKEVYSVKTIGDKCYLYCGKILVFAGTREQVRNYLDWLGNHDRAA